MTVETAIAAAGLIFVAAITPGPNNLIVLAAAVRAGLAGAGPAILGVVAGSLALLVLAWAGAGALFDRAPALRIATLVAGVAYLIWIGVRLAWPAMPKRGSDVRTAGRMPPATARGLALFQVLNPKSWVLVLTVTAAAPDSSTLAGLGILAALFVAIPGLCLTAWACAGAALAGWLETPAIRRRFDCAMGALLIASAAMLASGPSGIALAG